MNEKTTMMTVALLTLTGLGLVPAASALHIDYHDNYAPTGVDGSDANYYGPNNGFLGTCERNGTDSQLNRDGMPGEGMLCGGYSYPWTVSEGAADDTGCAPETNAGVWNDPDERADEPGDPVGGASAGAVWGCEPPETDVWLTVRFVGNSGSNVSEMTDDASNLDTDPVATGTPESGFARLGTNDHALLVTGDTGHRIYWRASTAYWLNAGHLTWYADGPMLNASSDADGGHGVDVGYDVAPPPSATCNNLVATGSFSAFQQLYPWKGDGTRSATTPITYDDQSAGEVDERHTICAAPS